MDIDLGYPDWIGLAGAAIILAGFFLNQHGSLASSDWRFPALNLAGSLLILFSLYFAFNFPSVVIEIAWLAISIYGLARSLSGAPAQSEFDIAGTAPAGCDPDHVRRPEEGRKLRFPAAGRGRPQPGNEQDGVGNMLHKKPLTIRDHQGMGWIRDLPDARDHVFSAPRALSALPPRVDLRPHCPKQYDQGHLGSCTANAIAGAVQFERERQKLKPDIVPSRLFIYYNQRVITGTVESDSGAQMRDGIKTVASLGVCPEAHWPYIPNKFAMRPDKRCYEEAVLDRVVSYSRVTQSLNQMKSCLASGFPFVFGFVVYESFISDKVAETGEARMPRANDRVRGGHAAVVVGYEDDQQRFIVRNARGQHWGQHGHFTIPYAYLLDPHLAGDFWTIRLVEER